MSRRVPTWAMVLLILELILLLIGYGLGVRHFSGRYPLQTSINGMDVSGKTYEEAADVLKSAAEQYTLTINERGGKTEEIRGADVGVHFPESGAQRLQEIGSELPALDWLRLSLIPHDYVCELDKMFDQDQAVDVINRLTCFDPETYIPVQDAAIVRRDGKFIIQMESEGSELRRTEAQQAILAALLLMKPSVDLEQLHLYREPSVTLEELKKTDAYKTALNWMSANIIFDFEDGRVEHVGPEDVASWAVLDEDYNWTLDKDLVVEWVKKNLAYKYDTFGLKHTFRTHSGDEVVLIGGDYGWCIARQDTAQRIIDAVNAGEKGEMEPEYQYKALHRGIDDIGGTYVEVSIDAQKLWCYRNGELVVETSVVTGNPNQGNATPKGSVWAFDCHKSPATLGTIDTMGYSSKVTYWMSFTGNVGLHDADGWRSSYGGNIYKTNGSHGCINCPKTAMATVYATCDIGYPIIVY